jgi:hypothetical protein
MFDLKYSLMLRWIIARHSFTCKRVPLNFGDLEKLIGNLKHAQNVVWVVPGRFKPGGVEVYPPSIEYVESYKEYRNKFASEENSQIKVVEYGVDAEVLDLLDATCSTPEKLNLLFVFFGASWDALPKLRKTILDLKNIKSQHPSASLVCIYSDTSIPRDFAHLMNLHELFDLVIVNDQCIADKLPCVASVSPSVTPISRNTFLNHSVIVEPSTEKVDWDIGIFGMPYRDRVKIYEKLVAEGLAVYMPGRFAQRLSYSEYLRKQALTKIQICTTLTYNGKGRQMKGHFGESLNAGSCTIVDDADVISPYFTKGEHYLKFDDTEDLVNLCHLLIKDTDYRNSLSRAGQAKYWSISLSENYWIWLEENLLGLSSQSIL